MPASISIGTNTGASSAHLAEALPIRRLISAENSTKPTSSRVTPGSRALSNAAPLMAQMIPSWLQAK